jgi:hypothetical protein
VRYLPMRSDLLPATLDQAIFTLALTRVPHLTI